MAQILVIDDDVSLLQMMSLMLKRAGHDPILATDGHEGIQIARSKQPDLAIVDVMMPDLSGYEVCRILRQEPATAKIPLLVLTALSQPEQRDLADEAGADDFITKPVTRDDLVSHVDDLLRTGPRNMPAPLEMPRVSPASGPPPAPSGYMSTPASRTATVTQPPTGPLTEPYTVPGEAVTDMLSLVAVMGLSSGVGATTLAVNLGQTLAQAGRACIVDLNTQAGQVAVQLRMVPPRATWLDLVGIEPGSDKRLIGGALMFNRALGLAVLAAPLQAVEDRLGSQSLTYVLNVLSEGFHHIVADLPPVLNIMNATALQHARHIVLVLGDDPARLIVVPDILANIERMKLPGRLYLVLNRTRPHGVTYEEVVATLNRPLAARLPYEPRQVDALNQGAPLVTLHPDSPFCRAVFELARQF